jgi:GxxExxY protein
MQELTRRVIGAFYGVYNSLGYGFLESVYRAAMLVELQKRGLRALAEVPLEVLYEGVPIGRFRVDMVVEAQLLLELKASPILVPADRAQLLNYLKAADLEVGLLLHFGPEPKIHRISRSQAALSEFSAVSASAESRAQAPTQRIEKLRNLR